MLFLIEKHLAGCQMAFFHLWDYFMHKLKLFISDIISYGYKNVYLNEFAF